MVHCNVFLESFLKTQLVQYSFKPTEENNRFIFCIIFDNKLLKSMSLLQSIEHQKNRKYLNLINLTNLL